MDKYIQTEIFVILICLSYGNGNFLSVRGRDYGSQPNAASENDVKGIDIHRNAEDGLVEGGGEVFVPKTFSLSSQEPTCEQLRAMWIFSRRQSRAAEITNEIPTYRDPFKYNVWEPIYPNVRTLGSNRVPAKDRSRSPVYGRVVSREPIIPQRLTNGQRQRLVDSGLSRFYGSETRPINSGSTRRSTYNRYMGGPNSSITNTEVNQNAAAVQGSFQKLKELIWTERAKDLTQQRRAEELAARAAVLKEIANGQNIQSSIKNRFISKPDYVLMDENRSPDVNFNQYLDDERVPIIKGQPIRLYNKNERKNGEVKAAPKSYLNQLGHESARNALYNQQLHNTYSELSNRRSRFKLPTVGLKPDKLLQNEQAVNGFPRNYPLRPSHFRERNRFIFKQRDTRSSDTLDRDEMPMLSKQIYENIQSDEKNDYLRKHQDPPQKHKSQVLNFGLFDYIGF